VGAVEECLVEGFNKATGQWIGRTSQFKTLNFLHPTAGDGSLGQSGSTGQGGSTGQNSLLGQYVDVRVTRSGANSLAGEYAG
jgi:tRNA-2-methylthio-N6-dimethylallyladenosine synthase